MKLRNLLRPFYVAGRIQNWLYEKRHPDHPWLAPGAFDWYLDRQDAAASAAGACHRAATC